MNTSENNMKDEINIETDCHTSGPDREVCCVCWKSFESDPKIRCVECPNAVLCLQCFSLGLETQTHHRSHAYHIDRRHIPLDPHATWTPHEDSDLLKALIEFGYGNFEDIGKRFLHKTTEEIRIRIDEILGLNTAPLLACLQTHPKPIVAYSPQILKEEPPRYPYRSFYSRSVAGYSAPRGDFEVESENHAENMLLQLESEDEDELNEEDKEITNTLSYALGLCYTAKLMERQRRKNVVKEHGLLLKKTPFLNLSLCDPRMLVYSQLMSHDDFTSLVEGFRMERALKKAFLEFRQYRLLGITRLRACSMYNKLNLVRQRSESEQISFTKPTLSKVSSIPTKKKTPPIDITNCVGFAELSEKERVLCANIRVLPEFYLKFKKMLIEVNTLEGGVRLMTARQLLKIDVNKTRQVYNYLRDEDFIKAK